MATKNKYLDLELAKYFGSKILETVKENFIRKGEGVTEIEAGASDAQLQITKTDIVSSVTVPGVVTTPSFDASTRTITLPVTGQESLVISLGSDLVIDTEADNKYNDETGNIELYFGQTDPETGEPVPVVIPVGDLVDIYNFIETDTIVGTVVTDVNTKEKNVTLNVKISNKADNMLQVLEAVEEDLENDVEGYTGGLYVPFTQGGEVDLTGYLKTTDVATTADIDSAFNEIDEEIFGLYVAVIKAPAPASQVVSDNNDCIQSITRDGNVFTITADMDNITAFTSSNPEQPGDHKWLALAINTGLKDITKVKYNNVSLTADDVAEADGNGCKKGYFILWLKADEVIETDKVFTVSATGYSTKTVTIKVEDVE